MPASSLLNAFVTWLRDRYHRTEEGAQKWQVYWSYVTTPPPGVRPPRSQPQANPEPYEG